MDNNPLIPSSDSAYGQASGGYVLPQHKPAVQPQSATDAAGSNEAIELIRAKLEKIYADAPDPFADAAAEKPASKPAVSEHQQFLDELYSSGKSPAEVQAAWTAYYNGLPDEKKHEVWREYYSSSDQNTATEPQAKPEIAKPAAEVKTPLFSSPRPAYVQKSDLQPYRADETTNGIFVSAAAPSLPPRQKAKSDRLAVAELKKTIQTKVSAGGKLKAKDHIHSLFFGLGVGVVTLVVFLFGFFNEVIIAPFIQPSRNVGATPIIINPSDVTASATPEVIIPKIHLEIPADYSQTSTNEATIETALENGIVHYPSTVLPGQTGNAAFFGHSSNNIFNPGHYKFAFVLLHELQPGDTFYLTYNGKVYVYKVFDKQIVEPDNVGVLNNIPGHTATAMLITCDPPGTSLHRLVVVGDQISPDPSGEAAGTNTSTTTGSVSNALPGNGPSLLSRIWNSLF